MNNEYPLFNSDKKIIWFNEKKKKNIVTMNKRLLNL